jgi:glucose dehydrogenase
LSEREIACDSGTSGPSSLAPVVRLADYRHLAVRAVMPLIFCFAAGDIEPARAAGPDRGQEATPVIIDGVMHVSTAWSMVRAFDAKTGRPLGSYDPLVPRVLGVRGCCDVVNRGAAAWKGKIYVGTFDGRLVSLDA